MKRGVESLAGSSDPRPYTAGGLKVNCPHCGSDGFREYRGPLKTALGSSHLICDRCGLVLWFAKLAEPIPAKPKDPEEWPDV